MFKFRSFRAISDLDSCQKYKAAHRQVLIDYGISNITTNTDDWMHNPEVYCVVAELEETGEIIGGVRVHVSTDDIRLPVETAVGEADPGIYGLIRNFRENGGVGELCALWNAKKVAGLGISLLLIRAGISIVNQIEFGSLVTICADYTMDMVRRVGFMVEESLGKGGEFFYPNEKYIARVLHRIDTYELDYADAFDKQRIFDLRKNPVQRTLETGGKKDIMVDYNLILKQ
jgi:hypothetical protein